MSENTVCFRNFRSCSHFSSSVTYTCPPSGRKVSLSSFNTKVWTIFPNRSTFQSMIGSVLAASKLSFSFVIFSPAVIIWRHLRLVSSFKVYGSSTAKRSHGSTFLWKLLHKTFPFISLNWYTMYWNSFGLNFMYVRYAKLCASSTIKVS